MYLHVSIYVYMYIIVYNCISNDIMPTPKLMLTPWERHPSPRAFGNVRVPDMVGRDGQVALVLQALDDVQVGPLG